MNAAPGEKGEEVEGKEVEGEEVRTLFTSQ